MSPKILIRRFSGFISSKTNIIKLIDWKEKPHLLLKCQDLIGFKSFTRVLETNMLTVPVDTPEVVSQAVGPIKDL